MFHARGLVLIRLVQNDRYTLPASPASPLQLEHQISRVHCVLLTDARLTCLFAPASPLPSTQDMPPPARKRGRGGGAAGFEYISLDGLRLDGRRPNEVRKIRSALGTLSRADGSAYYEQGHTRILAAVYGPREPRQRGDASADRATIKCEVSTASFASAAHRRARKGDRKSSAVAGLVQRVMDGVVLGDAYARSQIDVYLQVLQNDGALAVAAVNAAALALVDAGVAMADCVVACSVGFVDGVLVVDPNALESGGDRAELTLAVMAHSGKVCACLQESRLPGANVLGKAIESASGGAKQIFRVLEYELRNHSLGLLDSRGIVAL